jgi:hypothetical protein
LLIFNYLTNIINKLITPVYNIFKLIYYQTIALNTLYIYDTQKVTQNILTTKTKIAKLRSIWYQWFRRINEMQLNSIRT